MLSIFSEIMKLSKEDRIQLADAIWDSAQTEALPYSIDAENESDWYEKKLEEQSKTPKNVVSWEEMKSRILKRL